MEAAVVEGDEMECEFCSLEFASVNELDEHTLQHFNQKLCSECGTKLIRIGSTWFSPHNSCDCGVSSTGAMVEVEIPEEILLPDFIEVKQEEIFDMREEEEEEEEEVYNNIFDDNEDVDDDEAQIISDEENEINEETGQNPSRYSISINTKQDQCPLCDKTFSNDQKLIEHINQHNGFNAQPYSLTGLKKQKASNSNEKSTDDALAGLTEEQLSSRKCPLCAKIIVNKQNLICHMNIHRGIKPFVCSVCNKSFAHIRNLIRHKEQQRHCEMEFKCSARGCKKSFMSANKLHRHERLEHIHDINASNFLGKPYPCDRCEKSFMSLGFLKMHSKRHDQ